jgi:hypothetical protein
MSLNAINAPDQLVNGILTKWSAAFHPVIYDLQREDQQIQVKQTPPSGFTQLVTSGAIPSEVAAGQLILYIAPTGEQYTWTIGAVTNNTIYTSDGTIAGTEFGGSIVYLGAFQNYYVEAEIFSINTSNTYISVGTMRIKMSLTGGIRVNVSKWLQTLARVENNFDYDVINKAVEGEGGRYSISFTEFNSPSDEVPQQPFAIRYWSNSAKQIQDLYGASMAEHCPTVDASRDPQAKFMSVFDKPTYFVGYPFSLNFLYSDNLGSNDITREEELFDVNGGSLSTSSESLDLAQRFFNNRLMLEQGYASTVKELDVWLESGAQSTEPDYSEPDYEDGTYNEPSSPSEPPIKPVKPQK